MRIPILWPKIRRPSASNSLPRSVCQPPHGLCRLLLAGLDGVRTDRAARAGRQVHLRAPLLRGHAAMDHVRAACRFRSSMTISGRPRVLLLAGDAFTRISSDLGRTPSVATWLPCGNVHTPTSSTCTGYLRSFSPGRNYGCSLAAPLNWNYTPPIVRPSHCSQALERRRSHRVLSKIRRLKPVRLLGLGIPPASPLSSPLWLPAAMPHLCSQSPLECQDSSQLVTFPGANRFDLALGS